MWGLRKGSGYQRLTRRRTQYKKISFLFWSGRKKASDWAAEKYSRCGVGKFQVLIRSEKCGRKRDQASFLGYQVDGGTVVKPRIIAGKKDIGFNNEHANFWKVQGTISR